ncbi:hypothetical protein VTL71DRAFT_11058 [Oculimacula yallundae]|uniref:Uncharacterized protein n=1 Tax=Oculimacula yallundae TaxID=86028 RepID=A0ABR4CV74_9HELO
MIAVRVTCFDLTQFTSRPHHFLHSYPQHQFTRALNHSSAIERWKLTYSRVDHAGLADGTAAATEHLPRYFAKAGYVDADPKKTKKNGAGKGGWGVDGEEVQDEGFNLAKARRRSNSSSYTAGLKDFKTKFEHIETDPVFEEDVHGAGDDDELPAARRVNTESSDGSIDEDDKAKSV